MKKDVYFKLSSAKISYDNEASYQDWKLRMRERRKKLVADGVVSFEPIGCIGFYVKVKGVSVTILNRFSTSRDTNRFRCGAVFSTVIAMMEG